MLILISLTFLIFVFFWIVDIHITRKVIRKVGKEIELNPIARFLIGGSERLWFFKAIFFFLTFFATFYLTWLEVKLPLYVILGYILIYSLVITSNSSIYFRVTGRESLAFKILFILVSFSLVGFIYLNFFLYNAVKLVFSSYSACRLKYGSLLYECKKEVAPPEKEVEKVGEILNISIPVIR